jgi:hypothetical protein
LNGAGFTAGPRADSVDCKKGWLWPFGRSPGDCLTDAEMANGQTGVYRADQVVATVAPAAAPAVTQVSAPGPVSAASSAQPVPPAPEPVEAAPACRKGWLWPFVRQPGDCPTDAERANSRK